MMKRITQVLYNKAHFIFEEEEIPQWPPYSDGGIPLLIDITNKPEVQEGWDYNSETGEFTEPVPPEPIEPGPEYIEPPTIEEQILAESLYQTALLEISMIGGV